MKPRFIILSILSASALSGCENGSTLSKMNPFGQPSATAQTSADIQMREDNGAVDWADNGTGGNVYDPTAMSNSSIEVYGMDGPPQMQGEAYPPSMNAGGYQGNTMPSYGGGVATLGDSSVEIYPVDGPAPMMNGGYDGGGYNGGYAAPQQAYGQNNYGYGGGSGNQVFFKHGSSRLGSGDKRVLSNVAEQAKFAPVNRITVEGYASQPSQAGSQTVEGRILNLKESMNRTFAVSKELMQKGVPAEKIKAVSWGSTKPTGNEQQDRRVDVIMGER